MHTSPRTVLLVDLENSTAQLHREFAKLIEHVPGALAGTVAAALDRFHVISRSDGLVLDSERDVYGDRAWLDALVAEVGAELLILGPIYKMIDGDATEELPNRNMVKWLRPAPGGPPGGAPSRGSHAARRPAALRVVRVETLARIRVAP